MPLSKEEHQYYKPGPSDKSEQYFHIPTDCQHTESESCSCAEHLTPSLAVIFIYFFQTSLITNFTLRVVTTGT